MYVFTQMFFLVDQSRQLFQNSQESDLMQPFYVMCDVYAFFLILALPILTRWDRYLNKMKMSFFRESDLFQFSLCYIILPNIFSLLFSWLLPILQVLVPTCVPPEVRWSIQ